MWPPNAKHLFVACCLAFVFLMHQVPHGWYILRATLLDFFPIAVDFFSIAVPTLIKKLIATFFTAGHAMSGADCYFNH